MIERITVSKLMELYLDTLNKCGMYLLNSKDKVIEYDIFEEFDIGVISFLHDDNLKILRDASLINDVAMQKSSKLRKMVIDAQHSDIWNVEGVRNSLEWRKILALADNIKEML